MSGHTSASALEAGWKNYTRPIPGQEYRHYKGGRYVIVETGFIEETEAPCVIYKSLLNNTVWVRTAENFFEQVEYGGVRVHRFAPIE